MSKYIVNKTSLRGEITIPSSKSHTLRAILFGALGKGKSLVEQYLPSNDTFAMIEACRLLGAKCIVEPKQIEINGNGGSINYAEDVINAGNSGIVLRFCSAIGALSKNPIVVTGDHSIRYQRPIKPLLEGLSQLGVSASSMRGDGYAPVIIQGPMKPGKAIIEGADSQPVSAMLIASAFARGQTEIHVRNPGEKPWIETTLDWFDRLGIRYHNNSFEHYKTDGSAEYDGFQYSVSGDLSSAAFPIAAALITHSELTLKNINMDDSQGDKELINVFQKMGAKLDIDQEKKILHVRKSPQLFGIKVDINNFIDSITILAVVACFAEGETHIKNAAIAKQKECNRIHCIATELRKMGADILELEDGLIIKNSKLKGISLNSHHDHRMAMSLAVAAMAAEGESCISDIECVGKTFPTFVRDFSALGANIREEP